MSEAARMRQRMFTYHPWLSRWPRHPASTQNVHVQVLNLLASVGTGVDDAAVPRL